MIHALMSATSPQDITKDCPSTTSPEMSMRLIGAFSAPDECRRPERTDVRDLSQTNR